MSGYTSFRKKLKRPKGVSERVMDLSLLIACTNVQTGQGFKEYADLYVKKLIKMKILQLTSNGVILYM